jgi:hypothetical protein
VPASFDGILCMRLWSVDVCCTVPSTHALHNGRGFGCILYCESCAGVVLPMPLHPFLSDIIMGNVVKGMFSSVAAVRLTAFLNCLSVQVMVNRSENRIRNCTIWGKVI